MDKPTTPEEWADDEYRGGRHSREKRQWESHEANCRARASLTPSEDK
jgi:hypothetical protein